MHGRKRDEYKAKLRNPKVAAGLEQKALQWHALTQELSDASKESTSTTETTTTLTLLEKALKVNPDPLHLWNHRRQLPVKLEVELTLTQAALERNPKAYGAWFHRKWALQQYGCCRASHDDVDAGNADPVHDLLQNELTLTSQLLKLDERNFHCWNYRRFVVACFAGNWNGTWMVPTVTAGTTSSNDEHEEEDTVLMMGPQVGQIRPTLSSIDGKKKQPSLSPLNNHKIPDDVLQTEWEFTTQKIQDNFSNFSAFHYRSQLLPWKLRDSDMTDVLDTEWTLIEDAVCTEPDDQTAWWYHALLLDTYCNNDNNKERLEAQVELLHELLEESPGKWVLLGLYKLLDVLGGNDTTDERKNLLHRLIKVDPDRRQRYQHLLRQLEEKTTQQTS